MVLGFGVHTSAGVADGQHDVFARLQRGMEARIIIIQADVAGLDGQLAAFGIASRALTARFMMTCSIWPGSAFTAAEIFAGCHYQLDVFADYASKHLQVFADNGFRSRTLGASICLRLRPTTGE